MILIIRVDGTEEVSTKTFSAPFLTQLKFLQKIVGGWIEVVYMFEKQIIVNEEGRVKNLPVNEKASIISNRNIVGDVVILTENDQLT